MENLHLPMVLLPFFLLHFLSLLLLSSANYTEYFINCGSKFNITVGDRNFVGDLNAGSFSVGKSSNVSATNSATDMSLYQTARIFENPSSYEFDIIDYATHNLTYVRLHFFPLISGKTNLADALFDVSTSNFSLLSNFSIKDNSNSPLIEEFLLTTNESKFSIHFTPHRKSFAFVSAIEVFRIPDINFVMDNISLVTPAGSNGTYIDVRSHEVLRTIHRVNVGGPQNNDTLWRTWIPDDDYLLSRGSAKICPSYNGTLKYDVLGATSYSASDLVYRTCKQLNSNSSNITWGFHVNKNARHLVRLHFCDIVSVGADVAIRFNLLIYSNFSHEVYPNDRNGTEQWAAPFYYDFVVDSDDSGVMNVGVGTKSAYLNGVEIMEFTKESDVPIHGIPKKRVVVIVATACGAVFVFVLVVLFLLWRFRYKKAKHVDGVGSLPVLHGKRSPYRKGTTANPSPVRNVNLNLKMPLLEILGATHNFDTKRLIGEGGFGKVYKGTLSDGTKVAVKRSDSKHGQGLPEFETEILVLSKIRHRHLVSLKGYCEEGSEMILVYEFIENGTLRDHLYHLKEISDQRSSKRSKLSWKQRLDICIGSAKGLHYLHTSSTGGIIHRDVKSTNILLNEHYVAKVADFGLSRSGPHDPNHFSTVGIKGSFGYVDPEYFRSFEFTEKSDVYSFGVVLLEVLCARPAIIDSPKREEVNLAEWGMFWQKKGQLEKIIDPTLVGEINPDSLRKFGQTTEKCLKDDGADRPSMLDVQWDLEYALQLQQIALNKEPHDDTTTNAFLELPVPSDSVPDWEEDHVPILLGDNGSETINSEVFSQMRIDGAR